MTFLIYLIVCVGITLGLIFYGMRWQRQRQQAYLREEMDYEETSNQ